MIFFVFRIFRNAFSLSFARRLRGRKMARRKIMRNARSYMISGRTPRGNPLGGVVSGWGRGEGRKLASLNAN